MPLDLFKIESLRKKAKSQVTDTAIKDIADKDTKMSLPVVIKILQEILEELKNLNPSTKVQENIDFLNFSLHILRESDRIQNLGMGITGELSKISKDSMLKELNSLRENSKKIYIDNQTIQDLWSESVVWFKGMYYRSYIKYKTNADGSVVRNKKGKAQTKGFLPDVEDEIFYGIYSLNKIDIAQYYFDIAEIILKAIAESSARFILQAKDAPPPTPVMANSVDIPALASTAADQPSILQRYKTSTQYLRYASLVVAIDKIKLNKEQSEIYQAYKETIFASLRAYTGSYCNHYGVPTFIWARTHTVVMTEALNEVLKSNSIADDTKVIFATLNDVTSKNSDESKKRLEIILDGIIDIVYAEEYVEEVTYRQGRR